MVSDQLTACRSTCRKSQVDHLLRQQKEYADGLEPVQMKLESLRQTCCAIEANDADRAKVVSVLKCEIEQHQCALTEIEKEISQQTYSASDYSRKIVAAQSMPNAVIRFIASRRGSQRQTTECALLVRKSRKQPL